MFIFPAHILTPSTVRRSIAQQSLSGGRAISGDEDTVLADGGGRWVVDYSGIELVDADQARLWEAWVAYLADGAVECLVPLLSFTTSPRSYFGKIKKRPSRLSYDDPEWPTFMRYAAPEHAAVTDAPASLRATVLDVRVDLGAPVQSGQVFSCDNQAYRVVRPADGGGFHIVPPLRGDTPANTPCVFDFPLMRARATPGQELGAPLFRGRQATVNISFWESV